MSDRYVKTTTESWGGRLKNSVGGIFGGFVFIIGAVIMLWWNEGRAVQTAKSLEEGIAAIVNLDSDEPEDSNNGELVHLTAEAVTDETFLDEEFEIETDALRIKRVVEVYQWKETKKSSSKKNIGGSKTTTTEYTYNKVWSEDLISSSEFEVQEGHYNPNSYPVAPYESTQRNIEFGGFEIPESLMDNIIYYTPLEIDDYNESAFHDSYIVIENNADKKTCDKIFIGSGSNATPNLGDAKVSFEIVPQGEFSVIAEQDGNTFKPFQTEAGDKLFMISTGDVSSKKMFEHAQQGNTILTWGLRVFGLILIFMGFKMITSIISTILDVIPILGTIMDFGLSAFAGVMSFTITLITISIAWIYYRPILGISLLVVAAGIILFFYKKGLDKKRV